MFLSIIIPCYNAERWVARCLDSILNQGVDDMEIIAVNDGSKDGTLSVLREYENLHPSIIKVVDKSNGGAASARNKGLDIAQGKYVMFVDADDQIVENTLKYTIDEARKQDTTDVIYLGMCRSWGG